MPTRKVKKTEDVEEVVIGPSKDELETKNLNDVAEAEREFPAPKLVSTDNGTQSFDGTVMEKVTAPEFVQGAYAQDNTDPSKLVTVDNIETPVVVREKRVIDGRLHKADFQRFIDEVKVSRPEWYLAQKDDLEKQMANAPE